MCLKKKSIKIYGLIGFIVEWNEAWCKMVYMNIEFTFMLLSARTSINQLSSPPPEGNLEKFWEATTASETCMISYQ